ncbi:unnamed protein product [Menidia menidia]|uniref:(Atlantic silverside) hypothetical protein n=1 Tax=Menidia menidia TaxID=238744 RepID=A0A8S4AXE7_9TELE|nr:unnamed protein product [Menidia menidia]
MDQVYTNVADAYRAQALAHLGLSDHLSLLLHPQYTPKIKSAETTVRTVRIWPESAVPMLQDCFHHTDWDVFREQGTVTRDILDNYTISVLDYICFCLDNVTTWKQSRVSGDHEAYSRARTALRRGIKSAKQHHRRRIEARFADTANPRQVWEGIRAITDYKKKTPSIPANSSTLAEDLNVFYARFDKENTDLALPPLPPTAPAPVLTTHEVSSAFNTIRPYKLRHRLHQLGLNTTLCNWTVDFLTNRTQRVRVGNNISSTLSINTGAPQGRMFA